MAGYKSRHGSRRASRKLEAETPLGVLSLGWHDVTVKSVSCSSTSIDVVVKDQWDNQLDTRLFIRQFDDPSSINSQLKFFLASVLTDPKELTVIIDGLLDGEFHMIGALVMKQLRVQVGMNGEDIDIVRYNKKAGGTTTASPTGTQSSFPF